MSVIGSFKKMLFQTPAQIKEDFKQAIHDQEWVYIGYHAHKYDEKIIVRKIAPIDIGYGMWKNHPEKLVFYFHDPWSKNGPHITKIEEKQIVKVLPMKGKRFIPQRVVYRPKAGIRYMYWSDRPFPWPHG